MLKNFKDFRPGESFIFSGQSFFKLSKEYTISKESDEESEGELVNSVNSKDAYLSYFFADTECFEVD